MNAAGRWSDTLTAWRIPDEILAQAPESPWGFPPSLFGAHDAPGGALHRLARASLGDGHGVVDIGCGGGAASLPLAPPARHLIGVDSSPEMLVSFAAARLSRLAFRVVWVNPRKAAPRYAPLTGGMAAALPHIDAFVSGHSLAAFDEVLAAIGASEPAPTRLVAR